MNKETKKIAAWGDKLDHMSAALSFAQEELRAAHIAIHNAHVALCRAKHAGGGVKREECVFSAALAAADAAAQKVENLKAAIKAAHGY